MPHKDPEKRKAYDQARNILNRDAKAAYMREWTAKNQARMIAYRKARYIQNREKVKAESAAWRKANPEYQAVRRKIYYQKNKAVIAAKWALYRKENRGKVAAAQADYVKRNPVKMANLSAAKRARKKAATIAPCEKAIAAIKKKRKCYWCGCKVPSGKMTVDHVVAIASGGNHDPSNLVPSCQFCNSSKRVKSAIVFTKTNSQIQQLAFA